MSGVHSSSLDESRRCRGEGREFASRVCPIAALAIVSAALLLARTKGRAAVSPQSVTSCRTIRKAGFYEIDSTLTESGGGDCLAIAASNVVINLNGWLIAGGGGGAAGVHVLPMAANAYIEGRGARISGFTEGMEIEGSGAVAENFTASSNSDAGVYLNKARQARVANFTTSQNLDGVRIYAGTSNAVQGITATGNLRYGVWLKSTNYNAVGGFAVKDNEAAGVYLGCSLTGPQGIKCDHTAKPSNYNAIFGGTAVKDTAGGQAVGVAIDLGNGNNRVGAVTASFNSQFDVVDANPDCGTDIWIAVVVGTSNQSGGCIP